jgi:RNA polymerase sigma-70 factor (ECF subfamily)
VQRAAATVPVLIERAKQQDREAFAELYRMTLTPVYRYLGARVRTVEEAEELTQDVYLAALSQIEGLRAVDESGLYAWLFQIARFKLADQLRARYRRPAVPLDGQAEPADLGPLPEEFAEASADRETVREAMTQLTDEQREVVTCKYILGFSNDETARQLGKTVNAVNQLHHRALRRLQRVLVAREVAS